MLWVNSTDRAARASDSNSTTQRCAGSEVHDFQVDGEGRWVRPVPTGPDRVSVGALTKVFPPELVVETTDTREVRRRLLPTRLVVYFVLALWLFRC